MKLSVIIPFYDETIFVRQAVDSCLRLGEALHEVIIIDDGPLELSSEFFSGLPDVHKIQVHANPVNSGGPISRNHGLERSSGEFVIYLDADDLITRESMLEALKFAHETRADITHLPTLSYRPNYGAWERFERDHALLARRKSRLTIDEAPELRYSVATWSWLFRREFLIENGLRFDATQRRYADHLYAVKVLQAAERISTFDQYPHVWRRRGASLSSRRENLGDFRDLIASIDKTCAVLAKYYDPADDAYQRDLCFFAARMLGQWSLLDECIPRRESSDVAASVLSDLAVAMRRYDLHAAITHDAIMRKLFGSGLERSNGVTIALDQIPDLYAMASREDWSTLAKRLGIQAQETRTAPVADAPENSPTYELWSSYESRAQSSNGFEHRLFTEFLVDEADGFARRCASQGRYQAGSASEVTGRASCEWTDTMRSTMSHIAVRFGCASLVSPRTDPAALDALRDEAAALTDAYILSRISPDPAVDAPRRSTVLDAWRAWEAAVLGPALDGIGETILQRAHQARFGDANWRAERTWKSRLRANVLERLLQR